MELNETAKIVVRNVITTLGLSLIVMVAVHAVDVLYDTRIVLGVLAGRFGFEAVSKLVSKIKGLE